MLEFHLEKLVVFVGVVDAGSIRRYAVMQRLSQPGVSQRISGLERLIGAPLLSRSRTGVSVTAQGRVIYNLGLQLIYQTQQVEAQLQSGESKRLELRFGTYDSVAIYLMPAVMKAVQRQLPHVHLQLICDRSSNLLKQIADGSLHAGLCVVDKIGRKLVVSHLYDDEYGFYASSAGALEKSLVTMEGASAGADMTVIKMLKGLSLQNFHVVTAPSFEVAKAMTQAGLGVGVLPHRVAAKSLLSGALRRVTPPVAGAPVSFGSHAFGYVRTRGMVEMAELRVLLEIIQAELIRSAL